MNNNDSLVKFDVFLVILTKKWKISINFEWIDSYSFLAELMKTVDKYYENNDAVTDITGEFGELFN